MSLLDRLLGRNNDEKDSNDCCDGMEIEEIESDASD
jgi:hypothetical protein